ncbi:MAG: SpoIIE family protein phosphatase [Eubacterium sp.]|nr:SpoIIE family protein phosphatase [Eubacterium sp.]
MEVKERKMQKNKAFQSKTAKTFFEGAIYFALAFCFSAGKTVTGVQPFGVSLIAVSKNKNIIFSFLGSVLGYLIGGIDIGFARYLASAVLALIGAIAANAFDLNSRPFFPAAASFFSVFVCSFTVNIKLQCAFNQYIVSFAEALLCFAGAFFFYKSINSNYKRVRLPALPVYDQTCIIISLSLLLLSLSYFRIENISPAKIIAIAAVLLTLRLYNLKLGMIAAIAAGFSVSLSKGGELFMLGALALAYLLAALFFEFSAFSSGVVFICAISFFCIASESTNAFPFFEEALAGDLIFLLFPSKLNRKIEDLRQNGESDDSSLRQSLVLKLRFASSAMAAISESVDTVREKIDEITRSENEAKRSSISEEEYLRREIILEKTNQIRSVASDQFYSISGMLEDLAFEFDEAETFDSEISKKIRNLLFEHGIFPESISAVRDKYSRMRVEILLDNSENTADFPDLEEEIGKICSRYFEKGILTNLKNEKMISFFEKPNYKISFGFAQHTAEGKLCGDTVKIINNCKGRCILIISDGMGKGSRAALDGAMGAGLISKLINAGFGFDTALKVVNSALFVKSNDESLATLDIASIDMFTGKCEFYKAGAPLSYVLKSGKVLKCELSSMPAGILRGVEFAKKNAVLKPGESVVLLSDGLCELGEEWLEKALLESENLPPQERADLIIKEAEEIMQGKKTDDMSIIIAKSERN